VEVAAETLQPTPL